MLKRVLIGAASLAAAQAQEAEPRLTDASAQAILGGCFDFAVKNELTVAIAVLDDRTRMVAYRRMDGLRQGPADLAVDKADYAARWGAPTKSLADRVAEGNLGWALSSGGTPIEGGVPVYAKDGRVLGGVGVSGASAADDARCARAGIEAAGLSDRRGG